MKKLLILGILLMGFTFTVTQGLLIRELLVAFFGNELSIGLILGNWLILEAVGSGILGRLTVRWGQKPSSYAALQILFALFLPICLYATYISRTLVGAIPGEGVALLPIYWLSLLILTPLALVDGAMFPFGSRVFATLNGSQVKAISKVYIYEAVGAIIGGLAFTYLFIPFLNSIQIALLLSSLNLLSAALILTLCKSKNVKRWFLKPGLISILIVLVACLAYSLSPAAERLQLWAASQQWGGLNLIYTENSVYGNVAVVQLESQYTFFADGIPILTAPVPDIVLTEEIVHIPMLFLDQPERALVISGGLGGVLSELAKYPLQKIDYAELDPLLIEAVEEFSTSLTINELSDPRVGIEHLDGRLMMRRKAASASEKYDLVIVNLPYPSTLQLNRYYTEEFFHMVRELLTEGGILVIQCPGTLSYMSDELRDLNLMVFQTLGQAFPHVRPIPGELTLWLASPAESLSTVPLRELVMRWETRNLETRLITAPHIRLKLNQIQLDWFWQALFATDEQGKILVNQDLHPVGLFYGLSYWHAIFSPQISSAFKYAGQIKLSGLILALIGSYLLLLATVKATTRGRGIVLPIAIAATGFTGMTADLVMIYAFQSLYGYVYHWIGLFITAFMAGLSIGGLLMSRKLARIKNDRRALFWLELSIVLYWGLVFITLDAFSARLTQTVAFASTPVILLLLNLLGGFLVGSQFPLANHMYLKRKEESQGQVGTLYASDLVGAFLSSIAVSIILIPLLGILITCLIAALIKLGTLLLVSVIPSRS